MSTSFRGTALLGRGRRTACRLGLLLAAACSDDPSAPGGTGQPPFPDAPVEVSAPIESVGPAPETAFRLGGTVWVSMTPGTEPLGSTAELRGLRRPETTVVTLVDGGFDPVPIQAEPGETLMVTIARTNGQRVTSVRAVPRSSRPRVVRVSPPNRRTTVPLNSIVRVVFSEPMDSGSVAGALRLESGGSVVAATLSLQGGGVSAVLTPAVSLAPQTSYRAVLAGTAQSLAGQTMPAGLTWDFVTDSTTAPPLPPPDTTGPVVTIQSPAAGATLSADFPIFQVDITDPSGLTGTVWTLLDGPAGQEQDILGEGSPVPGAGGTRTWSIGPFPGPGTFTFVVRAFDGLGQEGRSAPIQVTLVPSDTTPRLEVRSFEVRELTYPGLPDYWFYVPQLTVADAPGAGGLEILGFELLDVPGLPLPFPRMTARSRAVPAGQDVPLFTELYGDWELSFNAADGRRTSGTTARARLTYRDPGTGQFYATVLQGPIVPGGLPTSYTGGCGHWYYLYVVTSCPAGLRQVVGRPPE